MHINSGGIALDNRLIDFVMSLRRVLLALHPSLDEKPSNGNYRGNNPKDCERHGVLLACSEAARASTLVASGARSNPIPAEIPVTIAAQSGFVFGFPSIKALTAPKIADKIAMIPSVLVCQCFMRFSLLSFEVYVNQRIVALPLNVAFPLIVISGPVQ